MSKTKSKLILIDGNAIIHRSFHALPPTLKTKQGTLVNAVYGFTSFLLSAITEFRPKHLILTLDKKGATFRHKEYKEYKATRLKAPDELYEQIPLIKKVATSFSIPIFEKTGFEADDLIGTLSAQAEQEKNLETIIITGDLDTLQLVSDKTKVYTASRGISDNVLYDINKIKERYNLSPQQIIDLKALAGDASDNIPGAKGIGQKTASQLLLKFGDIETLYKKINTSEFIFTERIKSLLLESKDNVFLSKKLATIDRQVPITLNLSAAQFANFDLDKILQIFSDLEFKSLLNKVKSLRDLYAKKSNSEQKKPLLDNKIKSRASNSNYKFIRTDKEFANFWEILTTKKSLSLALSPNFSKEDLFFSQEKEGIPPTNLENYGIAFSWQKNEAWFLFFKPRWWTKLKMILEDKTITKTAHDLKFVCHALNKLGIKLQGLEFDIMIASYVLNPGKRQHDLDSLAFIELSWDKLNKTDIFNKGEQLNFNFFQNTEKQQEQIALLTNENADLNQRLKLILSKKLKEANLNKVFYEIEMPLISVLAEMEQLGIKVEIKVLRNLSTKLTKVLQKIEKDIFALAQEQFNLNSPKQLQEILFTKLTISNQGIKKTKTGLSTAEEELNKLQHLHPIISLIQSYRELKKIETTYVNSLPKLVNKNTKKIHSNFNQAITATGRLSSTDPNLQNIPTRTTEGREIRRAFVASQGYKFLSLDYSQIELRIAAHMSNDQNMIRAFLNNLDIHSSTAAAINNIGLSQVSSQQRREAKAVNFGILYGQGPHGLSQTAGISYFNAQNFIKRYFANYPRIKKMIDNFILSAEKKGYAETLFGRKRPLPDINSSLPISRRTAKRMAINTPIQGTAADLIKLAMIEIFNFISNNPNDLRLLLQVHDELIFEIKTEKIDQYLPQLKSIMENIIKLKVPIIVDFAVGDNWAELK